jgi:hypothetical protein
VLEEHDRHTVRRRDWHTSVRAKNAVTVTKMKKTLCERGTRQRNTSRCDGDLWYQIKRVERVHCATGRPGSVAVRSNTQCNNAVRASEGHDMVRGRMWHSVSEARDTVS